MEDKREMILEAMEIIRRNCPNEYGFCPEVPEYKCVKRKCLDCWEIESIEYINKMDMEND